MKNMKINKSFIIEEMKILAGMGAAGMGAAAVGAAIGSHADDVKEAVDFDPLKKPLHSIMHDANRSK